MHAEVRQRLTCDGNRRELGDLCIVHKGNKSAHCQLVTNQLGLPWKAAMQAKGRG